jgi:hypothetical protein
MNFYSVTKTDDCYLLKNESIDLNFFNKVETKDGNIKLIPKEVKVININRNFNSLKDYNFNLLKLISFKCDGEERVPCLVGNILHYIYHKIGDGGSIIRNSCLNLKTNVIRGWNYSRRLGISYPPCDDNLFMAEIYHQSLANDIWLELCFRINENLILKISTNSRE